MDLPVLSAGGITLLIRARPGAKKTSVRKILEDGSIKIDIAAAPEDNAANAELITFLAAQYEVAASHIEIVSGQTSRIKTIRVRC